MLWQLVQNARARHVKEIMENAIAKGVGRYQTRIRKQRNDYYIPRRP